MVRLKLVRADEPALQRHVVAQQRVGDHTVAVPEIFARVARFQSRPFHAELLTIDSTIQCVEVERVMREDRQAGDSVTDPVVSGLQRRLTQVLLVGRFQHVVRNVAGPLHDQVAVIHRLGNDDRHQTVRVGDLFGVTRLQGCQRRQELALSVDKAEHIGHIRQ